MSNPFNRVGRLKPRRHVFDLSYRINGTCDMGQLIPCYLTEVVAGDFFQIANQVTIRFQPLIAPVMHEISCTTHYFFIPYRIMWDNWVDFINGPENGLDNVPIPLPVRSSGVMETIDWMKGSLWDYFGFPLPADGIQGGDVIPPVDFPWRAYNMVYNEYYRDQDLQTEVSLIQGSVLYRNWKKDYFTSARPFRQKGPAPALPVNILANDNIIPPSNVAGFVNLTSLGAGGVVGKPVLHNIVPNPVGSAAGSNVFLANDFANLQGTIATDGGQPFAFLGMNLNEVASGLRASTFDVSDLRLAVQVQKWLERNARAGSHRYTEFLQAHFGVSPTDERMQRPEYIGGTKMPVVISEVLQTSQSDQSPQATMAGHGLSADGQRVGKYNVVEPGIIIGIMSIMPKPAYQQGVNRMWLRRNPVDYYMPEFAHLSEQAIKMQEIYIGKGIAVNDSPFGYIGQYDELRVAHDQVVGEMRVLPSGWVGSNQPYWNLARFFAAPPALNSEFIQCIPDRRIFAVPSRPGIIYNVQNLVKAVRPLPLIAEPGLVDHF